MRNPLNPATVDRSPPGEDEPNQYVRNDYNENLEDSVTRKGKRHRVINSID
jgi:hypothetical protein